MRWLQKCREYCFWGEKKKEVIDMKLMIASDIHGSAFYCEKMIEAYKRDGGRPVIIAGGYSLSWTEK